MIVLTAGFGLHCQRVGVLRSDTALFDLLELETGSSVSADPLVVDSVTIAAR